MLQILCLSVAKVRSLSMGQPVESPPTSQPNMDASSIAVMSGSSCVCQDEICAGRAWRRRKRRRHRAGRWLLSRQFGLNGLRTGGHGGQKKTLAKWADSLPFYNIVKDKITCPANAVPAACEALRKAFPDAEPATAMAFDSTGPTAGPGPRQQH